MAVRHLKVHQQPGSQRREQEIWSGNFEADAGSLASLTKFNLAEANHAKQQEGTSSIVFDSANNEFDLAASTWFQVELYVTCTGASSVIEIYDVTNSAALFTIPAAAGAKILNGFDIITTTAISIAIRGNGQTANTIGAAATMVRVTRIGELLT